jgi:uncharacterized membrane protein YhdT
MWLLTACRPRRGLVSEESPEKLFKHAVWDAATTIVYVLGALVVHYLLKLFGHEGVPTLVKISLIALEIGFVLTAVGLLVASLVIVISNLRKLAREFSFQWLRTIVRSDFGRSGRWLLGIFCSILIFINILIAIFVQGLALKASLIALLALLFMVAIILIRKLLYTRKRRRRVISPHFKYYYSNSNVMDYARGDFTTYQSAKYIMNPPPRQKIREFVTNLMEEIIDSSERIIYRTVARLPLAVLCIIPGILTGIIFHILGKDIVIELLRVFGVE